MSSMPILTSGRLLLSRGLVAPPYEDGGSDWAELTVVDVDEQEASLLGSYWNSGYRNFLATGDLNHLGPFTGETVRGFPLMTNTRLIEEFDEAYGHVDVREIYEQGS